MTEAALNVSHTKGTGGFHGTEGVEHDFLGSEDGGSKQL
jgi:hypothetical protein